MTAEVALETGRQRPQSGGFRTFLSWLKRDEQTSSTESISSCGSDNTVTSFAFLTPAHYKTDIKPVVLPPPGPPTDSYRKRIKDRNLRLHLDKDITLCRKYNLTADPINYDAFSLPNEKRILNDFDRGRRAASVYIQRRAPYVPGKRRAPAPPIRASSLGPTNAPFNRKSRKRQAPQPPKLEDKENIKKIEINDCNTPNIIITNTLREPQKKLLKNETKEVMDQKVEIKKTSIKVQSERSFLKQIFEGKKRISVCDPIAVRLLPSISELDRQAAEIMQMKLRNENLKKRQIEALERAPALNNIPNENFSTTEYNQNNQFSEKQELKKILKEMKDSLPKRTKPTGENSKCSSSKEGNIPPEPTTLRIVDRSDPVPGPSWQWSPLIKPSDNNAIPNKKSDHSTSTSHNMKFEIKGQSSSFKPIQTDTQHVPTASSTTNENINPIKRNGNGDKESEQNLFVQNTNKGNEVVNLPIKYNNNEVKVAGSFNNNRHENREHLPSASIITKDENLNQLPSTSREIKNKITSELAVGLNSPTKLLDNKETRRKELIFELEKCILEGNEEGAAKKATELAQLRISGSILSDSLLKTKINASPNYNQIGNKPSPIINVHDVVNETQNYSAKKSVQNAGCSGQLQINPIPDVVPSTSGQNVRTPETTKALVRAKQNNPASSSSTVEAVRKIIDENKEQIRERANRSALTRLQIEYEIKVYVESRKRCLGPAILHLAPSSTLAQLRSLAEKLFMIPGRLQRWVVGKTLCNDDTMVLATVAGPNLAAPFYLCIVEPDEGNLGDGKNNTDVHENNGNKLMDQLLQLEHEAIIYNKEIFECEVCMMQYKAGEGVILRECVHTFCKECISTAIQYCDSAEVHCPQVGCFGTLQDREIRSLVNAAVYETYLARSLAAAEHKANQSFHCRTKDCKGWALCDSGVTVFPCPVCQKVNCIPCEAIHEGLTCADHRRRVAQSSSINAVEDQDTKALLNKMLERGEALHCPECNNILTKQYGCDWVLCIACRTEICWVTRGRRWGPAGTGDTTGGCRCGIDGKKCHASCHYCH